MTPSDALPTIAEISITLAGFSTIVVVFRPAAEWTEHELVRIRALIVTCAVVLVCALLPFGLAGLHPSQGVIFGIPLVGYGLFNLSYLALTIRRIVSRRVEIAAPRLTIPVLAGSALVNIAVLLSGLGVFRPFDSSVLVLGLIWGLVAAVVTLLATVTFVTHTHAAPER